MWQAWVRAPTQTFSRLRLSIEPHAHWRSYLVPHNLTARFSECACSISWRRTRHLIPAGGSCPAVQHQVRLDVRKLIPTPDFFMKCRLQRVCEIHQQGADALPRQPAAGGPAMHVADLSLPDVARVAPQASASTQATSAGCGRATPAASGSRITRPGAGLGPAAGTRWSRRPPRHRTGCAARQANRFRSEPKLETAALE